MRRRWARALVHSRLRIARPQSSSMGGDVACVGAEIMHMAENGFCRDGEQERLLADGVTTLRGRLPINTDGGCLANGEPVGASGLRQICENVRQMRGQAGARQISKIPKLGYTHVYGAPGVSAVTILNS